MGFKSPTEAIFFVLDKLESMPKSPARDKAITRLRIAFENHEVNPEIVNNTLIEYGDTPDDTASSESDDDDFVKIEQTDLNKKNGTIKNTTLKKLLNAMNDSDFSPDKRSTDEKFKNPLSRFFESKVTHTLLHQPTTAMLDSVKKVSNKLIAIIKKLPDGDFNNFSDALIYSNHPIAFGSFREAPTKQEIIDVLESANPHYLSKIMHIHFKFAQATLRTLSLDKTFSNQAEPQGKLKEIIGAFNNQQYAGHENVFFQNLCPSKLEHIPDVIFYKSPLYTAVHGRGRLGLLLEVYEKQEGLFLKNQPEFSKHFPSQLGQAWVADVRWQNADFESPYVTDLINNDAVYVAGPSGMTSLFLGQMECLCNFQNITEKQNYLAAVVAYLGSGGFHSMHEVLGPAEYCLGIIPGYVVAPPSPSQLAPPPNFATFFNQQELIDPDFSARRQQVWQECMQFYRTQYKKMSPEPDVVHDVEVDKLVLEINESLEALKNKYGKKHEHKAAVLENTLNMLKQNGTIDIQALKNVLMTNVLYGESIGASQTEDLVQRAVTMRRTSDEQKEFKAQIQNLRRTPEAKLLIKLNKELESIEKKTEIRYIHQRGALMAAIDALTNQDSSKLEKIETKFPEFATAMIGPSTAKQLVDEVSTMISKPSAASITH